MRFAILHPKIPKGVELDEPMFGAPLVLVGGVPAPRDASDAASFSVSGGDGRDTRVTLGKKRLFRRRAVLVEGERAKVGAATPPHLFALALIPIGAVVLGGPLRFFGLVAIAVNLLVLHAPLKRRGQTLGVVITALASYLALLLR